MEIAAKDKLYSTFAGVASSLGYSEVHGRIIACLLVEGRQLSLDELSRKTGYSLSSLSISLDLLELVGIIRKMKNAGDRKLYVRMEGDMLESVRKAFIFKLQKEIFITKAELQALTKGADAKSAGAVRILGKEISRLEKYVGELEKVPMPE